MRGDRGGSDVDKISIPEYMADTGVGKKFLTYAATSENKNRSGPLAVGAEFVISVASLLTAGYSYSCPGSRTDKFAL